MSGERLSPARPGGGESSAYSPRFPWRIVIAVIAVGIVAVLAWQFQSAARLSSHKGTLIDAHNKFAAAETAHKKLRTRINALIASAIASEPEPFADPRLKLDDLHQEEGLYLRIPAAVAAEPSALEKAILSTTLDGMPKCLGADPLSLRSVFESGAFVGEPFRARIRDATEDLVLKALASEMKRTGMQHVEVIATAARAKYFLLVVERGETPRAGPVDVFLWDLKGEDALLLSARTAPRGLLVSARIDLGGLRPQARTPLEDSGIADDCSIAAQIKAVAGEPLQEFHVNEPSAADHPDATPVPGEPQPGSGPAGAVAPPPTSQAVAP